MKDLESESTGKVRLPLEIENLRAHNGTLSPVSLGRLRPGAESVTAVPKDVIVNPSRVFGEDEPLAAIAGEIYSSATNDSVGGRDTTWTLAYRVTDETGTLRLRGTRTIRRAGVATPFVLMPKLGWLTLGRYALELHTLPNGPSRTVNFEVDESSVDLANDYGRLVQMVSYSATGRELDSLRNARTLEERRAIWDRFWARRNADPRNHRNVFKQQYFQRIRYANTYYSTGEEGWRSDRGRIYIKYGPPDQAEEQPMTAFQPAYLLWHYFERNVVFIFADRDGFGRYVLVNTSRGE